MRRSCFAASRKEVESCGDEFVIYSSSSGEPPSFSPLCTFLCRRRLETTEKCRPQPSTSHANAIDNALVYKFFVFFSTQSRTYASRQCGCTCAFEGKRDE